jgi:hypothetical protein
VPRSIEYNWGTEFILLSVRALDKFVYSAHARIWESSQIGVFLGFWKEWNETFPTVPPAGQTDKWKVLKARVKAENVPKWAQPSQESMWESGWEVRDGAGKRVMECEMCTENDKQGRGWERQWQQRLQRCRTWPGMY